MCKLAQRCVAVFGSDMVGDNGVLVVCVRVSGINGVAVVVVCRVVVIGGPVVV